MRRVPLFYFPMMPKRTFTIRIPIRYIIIALLVLAALIRLFLIWYFHSQ